MCIDATRGLQHLHMHRLIHRDIAARQGVQIIVECYFFCLNEINFVFVSFSIQFNVSKKKTKTKISNHCQWIRNCLMHADGHLLIADFGMSRILAEVITVCFSTFRYISPVYLCLSNNSVEMFSFLENIVFFLGRRREQNESSRWSDSLYGTRMSIEAGLWCSERRVGTWRAVLGDSDQRRNTV